MHKKKEKRQNIETFKIIENEALFVKKKKNLK